MKIVNSVAVIVSCIALLFTNGSFRYGYADAVYIRNKSENFEKIASDIKFLTNSNLSDDKKTIIHRKMQVIANNLSHQGKADSLFYSANPLSIRNVDNVFYIPIGYDNEYKYIARVGWENESDNDAVSISYSKSFADILNTLQAGSYYFVKEDNSIYLRGNNQEYLVECGFENFDGNTENESLSIRDEYVTDIYNDNVIVNANNNRAIASSHINTHYYPNYGNYCFLCAAATICRYYGTSINIDTAHGNLTTSQHNVHTLAACPGGSGLEASQVIYTYTGKNGTPYENSLSASATMLYFGGTTPIYTGWFHYNNAQPVFPGHAMVLCGYIFDTVSLDFTYEFRDSDPYDQSEVYIISTFNASTVSYYSLGESYVWHLSIYNWN